MEIKMGKDLNVTLELTNDIVEAQIDNQIIKLDELALAYVGGGEYISAL
jgi:hypothetical protein